MLFAPLHLMMQEEIIDGEYCMIGKKAKLFDLLMCFGHLIQGYSNWK